MLEVMQFLGIGINHKTTPLKAIKAVGSGGSYLVERPFGTFFTSIKSMRHSGVC
jgi:hypothetical protein